jgi:helix-turn-helix protein
MYQSLPPILEDLDTLQARLQRERDPKRKPRLHLRVLLKSGHVTSRGQAAAYLALHRNTVAAWLRRYRDGGLEALVTYKEAGAPAGQKTLPPAVFQQLQARLATARRWAWKGPIRPSTAWCPTTSKPSANAPGPALPKKRRRGGCLCQTVPAPPRDDRDLRPADARPTGAGLLPGCNAPGLAPASAPAADGLRGETSAGGRAAL